MKRFLAILFSVIFFMLLLWGCDARVKENPASDFEYKKSENGDYILITKYVGTSEKVVIPSEIDGLPVKIIFSVGRTATDMVGAFQGSSIKSVVLDYKES